MVVVMPAPPAHGESPAGRTTVAACASVRHPGDGLPHATCTGSATVRRMGAPLFADDNSSYRRAVRRAEREERERERRRREIMDTLRRLKRETGDESLIAERERARRHADLLERYPPLY